MNAVRALTAAAACLVWLAGCETSTKFSDLVTGAKSDSAATEPAVTGSASLGAPLGSDGGGDELALGKRHYRAANYGLAEQHFRKAVEQSPRNAEAWLGLAAAYDRLRKFDLADRAYTQVIAIIGPTATVLNNQGYSYLLRGDYARARQKLEAAAAADPNNPSVKANLDLLARNTAGR